MISATKIKQLKEHYPVQSIISIDETIPSLGVFAGIRACVQWVDDYGCLHCQTENTRYVKLTPDMKYSLISKPATYVKDSTSLALKPGYYYEFTFSGGYTRRGIVIEYVSAAELGIYMHMRAAMATNTPGYAVIDTYGDLHIINPTAAKMQKTDDSIKTLLRKTVKIYKEWGTLYREYLKVLSNIKSGIRHAGMHPPEYYAAEEYRIQHELNAIKEAWDNCPHAGR